MRYLSFAITFAIALASLSGAAMAVDVEIALEAELANKIQVPMVIAVPADAKGQGGSEPDESSNGKFIWAPVHLPWSAAGVGSSIKARPS